MISDIKCRRGRGGCRDPGKKFLVCDKAHIDPHLLGTPACCRGTQCGNSKNCSNLLNLIVCVVNITFKCLSTQTRSNPRLGWDWEWAAGAGCPQHRPRPAPPGQGCCRAGLVSSVLTSTRRAARVLASRGVTRHAVSHMTARVTRITLHRVMHQHPQTDLMDGPRVARHEKRKFIRISKSVN